MAWRKRNPIRSLYDRAKTTDTAESTVFEGNGVSNSAELPSEVQPRSSEGQETDPPTDSRTLFGRGQPTANSGATVTAAQDGRALSHDSGFVVHDLVKGLEVSFGIEASQVEREAVAAARLHAEKGLPHHDREGKTEIEEFLARRSSGVLADWGRRARTRVEGSIQIDSEEIGKELVSLEQGLLHYRYLLDELRACRNGLLQAASADESAASEAAKAPKRRLAYTALLGGLAFWLFCSILVLADFVANVPVFNELLPSSPIAAQALENMERNAAANPTTYGLKVFFERFVMHPDASILAFSVILFLVVLAHFLGRSLRTITALHRTEAYVDEELIVRHRHQPKLVACGSVLGIAMIVGVLFFARGGIESTSQSRLTSATIALSQLKDSLNVAKQRNDPTGVQQLDIKRQNREATIPLLQARHEYAVSIAALNRPILFLNMSLALCAALLGYLHHSESLEVEPARSSLARPARERYNASRAAVEEERGRIGNLEADIDAHIRRVHHLAEARPLLNADGKAERLRSVIPLFRAENASARGMDTRSIRAFDTAPSIVANGELDAPFRIPKLFTESAERTERLRSEFRQLERDREAASEFAT